MLWSFLTFAAASLSLTGLAIFGCGPTRPQATSPQADVIQTFLMVRTGAIAPSGSFADCVTRAAADGATIGDGIARCREKAADILGRGAIMIGDLHGLDATGARGARCEALVAEPRDTEGQRLTPEERRAIRAERMKQAVAARQKAEQARAAFLAARDRLTQSPDPGPERDARVRALDGATTAYVAAWFEADFRAGQLADDAIPRKPAPIEAARDEFLRMVDGCLETVSFIEECNGEGWKSRDCRFLLGGLRDCLDPGMVRGGATCRHPSVGQRPRAVALVACDETDPTVCQPLDVRGRLYRFFVKPFEGSPPIACDDVAATIDASAPCVQVYSAVEFDVERLQRALSEAREAGKGVIWIVPLPESIQNNR